MTISPGKVGEVVKSGFLRRSFGTPVVRSAPIVLAERVTDLLGIVLLGVVAGAGVKGWPLLAVALVIVLVVLLGLRTRRLDRFPALGEARRTAAPLVRPGLLALATLIATVSWFFECLAAYVCVRGLGLDVSLVDTMLVFCLGSIAGAVSFLPGGLGVAEASMTALLRTVAGVAATAAAAATVLIRLATLWFAVALGLAGLGIESRLARSRGPAPAELGAGAASSAR
jgi:uncharacterized membrane protein YbhN (UPF0104 family)